MVFSCFNGNREGGDIAGCVNGEDTVISVDEGADGGNIVDRTDLGVCGFDADKGFYVFIVSGETVFQMGEICGALRGYV